MKNFMDTGCAQSTSEGQDVNEFLTSLIVERNVATSMQNQGLVRDLVLVLVLVHE